MLSVPTTGQYVVLTIVIEREDDGCWTAECKESGTATFGDSFEEAREAIEEAVELHLSTLEAHGERERFFRENNIAVYRYKPKKTNFNDIPIKSDYFINRENYLISNAL